MDNVQTFEGVSEVQHEVKGLLYEMRNINDNLRKFKKLELAYWDLSRSDRSFTI
jgi:hypothetical protein